jgi:hypothetical protein
VEKQGPQIGVTYDGDAVLVAEFSFMPCGSGEFTCKGPKRAVRRQHDLRVGGLSHIKNVVNLSRPVRTKASENSDKPGGTAVFGLRERECRP